MMQFGGSQLQHVFTSPGGLVKTQIAGPTSSVLNKLTGDVDAAGLGTPL